MKKSFISEIRRFQKLAGIDDPSQIGDTPYQKAKNIQFTVEAINDEIAILSKKDSNDLYAFWFNDDKEEMKPYGYDDINISDVVENYLNDNLNKISKGDGLNDWELGRQLVRIDSALKQDILDVWDKDKNIQKVLN